MGCVLLVIVQHGVLLQIACGYRMSWQRAVLAKHPAQQPICKLASCRACWFWMLKCVCDSTWCMIASDQLVSQERHSIWSLAISHQCNPCSLSRLASCCGVRSSSLSVSVD
jgi:hypothetical protein